MLNGHYSELLPVTSGVPHGSMFGPLLFITYMSNQKKKKVKSFTAKFVDYAKVGGKAYTTFIHKIILFFFPDKTVI